jgi:hypothetical protein
VLQYQDVNQILMNSTYLNQRLLPTYAAVILVISMGFTVGLGLTQNKSHVAGWYKSKIACGPEPKYIWTSMTLHSLAVADGLLAGYKFMCAHLAGRMMAIWGCSTETALQFKNASILCPS